MQVFDAKQTRGPVRRPQLSEAGPDNEADVPEQLERAGVGGGRKGGAALLSQLPPHSAEGPIPLHLPDSCPHAHVQAWEGPGAGDGRSESYAVTEALQLTTAGLGSHAHPKQAVPMWWV